VSVAAMLAGVCSPSGPVRAQAPAAPPTLVLLANQPAFGPGAGLSVTLGLQHTGAAVAADLYFGAILPDGDSVVFFEGLGLASRQGRLSDLSSLRPLIPGLAIATGTNIVVPDFFRYTWQGNEPPGTYQLFFAATVPGALRDGQVGAGDILAIETQSILNLPPATVTTDPGRAGSAVVGAAGGAVTASAGDGTLYTLNVPEGALAVDTTITLTPLTGLAGLPVPVTLAAGVRGEPSGLRFTRPATLVVELPQPLEGDVFGMPMPDSGAGFDLQPVARSGNRLQMPVEHFSVVAIPRTDAELAALIAPTSAYAQAIQLGTVALPGNPADVQALLAFMTAWYDTEIQPMLGAAIGPASDEMRLAALAQFVRWDERRVVMEIAFADVFPVGGVLTARATVGRQAALTILTDGYHSWNGQCTASGGAVVDRLSMADRAAGYVILGEFYLTTLSAMQDSPGVSRAADPDPASVGFTRPQILASLCAQETVAEVSVPSVPPGGAGQLLVRAGAVLGAEPVAFGSFMEVVFRPDPASSASTRAVTNSAGEASFPVIADASGHIVYEVCTHFRADQFPSGLAFVRVLVDGPEACRSSVTAVIVSPSQVTITPNASQQFSVVVEGTSNQDVTWSVDGGGTITQGGLFTSNGTAGTFFVRATSHEDPGSVGIAQVTVGTPPPPPPPPPPPGEPPCAGETCTFSGDYTFCDMGNPNNCTTFPSGSTYSHPMVSTVASTLRGSLMWTCSSGNFVSIGFDVTTSGSFSASRSSAGGPAQCVTWRSVSGTLSEQALQFTVVEFFQGHVITFSGTRTP
ncbi:MAG: hypothetical protein AB7Q16_07370, partial [Vicinamibacterales bacterium]